MLETSSKQMNLPDDLLQCQLCEMRSNSLGRHIVAKHGMTTAEYKQRFTGSQTNRLTPEQVARMRATKQAQDSKHKHDLQRAAQRREEAIAAGQQELQCQLCEMTSVGSLISHIVKKHGVSMDDYRTCFPGAVVQQVSPAQRRSNSAVMKRKLEDPLELAAFLEWRSFPSEVKHWVRKGFSPREAQQKVFEFQQKMSLKGNNEVTRAKRSAKNTGSGNPMSLDSIARREGVTLAEAHALTPCFGRTGDLHPFFGKKHTDEALAKIASAPHLSDPSYRSKPERQLEERCQQIADVDHNVQLKRWNVDVMFRDKKLIVELFGDYWHLNPAKYKGDHVHPLMRKTAQQVWDRDARKIQGLRELGYEVVVVWESDWHFDRDACAQRIKDAHDRTL